MENRAAKIHILDLKEDRISNLPEPILHRILCLVDQKTAIKTCVLSKAWRYLGCTRPKIDFYFLGGLISVNDSAILDRTLQAYHDRNLCLDEFSLWFSDKEGYTVDPAASASFVSKWIPIIIQNMHVKSLKLFLSSRPEVELPSLIFESHHINNLRLSGCVFQSSSCVDLKHPRRLHISNVCIPEETLDSVLSSCPFIEDVSISNCEGFTRIMLLSNKPENLTRFCFSGDVYDHHRDSVEIGNGIQTLKSIQLNYCSLSVSRNNPLMSGWFPCNLTRLSLNEVYIPEQILGDVLSNCTFIKKVSLAYCKGITRIALLGNNKPTNILASFCLCADGDVSIEIGKDMQTLRTIVIDGCMFSDSRNNNPLELARLRRLSLRKVQLSTESFSCNLHRLEELKLDRCSGIKEFNLSSRSMKRLSIHNISKPFRVTVDAPSIVSFDYSGIFPQFISFTTTSSDELWKSKINLGLSSYYNVDNDEPFHCLNELYGLLKAVSQSEISLELDQIEFRRFQSKLGIGDDGVSEEANHEPPVAVEHLTINRPDTNARFNSAAPFLNMLFYMFRPSFIYMGTDMLTYSNYQRAREIAELLLKERGTTIHESYIWQRVLEGVGLQVKYWNEYWQAVQYTSSCFRQLSSKCAWGNVQLRIHLKWRS